MKSIGIFYGSTTGNCERVANLIAEKLGVDSSNVKNVGESTDFEDYDVLLLGSSTWGAGDLQDDWEGAISNLESANLAGKTVAVFGVGDSASYSDTFCNAMGTIYDAAVKAGASPVGAVSTDGYEYSDSESVRDGKFVGLALDEDNESDKTDGRVDAWVASIKPALA